MNTGKEPSAEIERLAYSHIALIGGMHALAIWGCAHYSQAYIIPFLVAYFLTGCLGITLGYHRLLSHRSFHTSGFLRGFFATMGTLALQGGPALWVAYHRAHHTRNDRVGDPHSSARGFLWCHLLWLLHKAPNGCSWKNNRHMAKDILASPYLKFLSRYDLLINLTVALLFYLATRDLYLALWVFPVRIVFFWHCTWLVNSYAHQAKWKGDLTKTKWINSPLVASLTFGEGWHYNHHQFGFSARHGFGRLQPDPTWAIIRTLQALGLVWAVRLPVVREYERRILHIKNFPLKRRASDRPGYQPPHEEPPRKSSSI